MTYMGESSWSYDIQQYKFLSLYMINLFHMKYFFVLKIFDGKKKKSFVIFIFIACMLLMYIPILLGWNF